MSSSSCCFFHEKQPGNQPVWSLTGMKVWFSEVLPGTLQQQILLLGAHFFPPCGTWKQQRSFFLAYLSCEKIIFMLFNIEITYFLEQFFVAFCLYDRTWQIFLTASFSSFKSMAKKKIEDSTKLTNSFFFAQFSKCLDSLQSSLYLLQSISFIFSSKNFKFYVKERIGKSLPNPAPRKSYVQPVFNQKKMNAKTKQNKTKETKSNQTNK